MRTRRAGRRAAAALLALALGASEAGAALSDLQVAPPAIAAEAYVLLDALTGEVIAAQQPDLQLPPASLTKMMTAYLAFSAVDEGILKLEDTLPVSARARQAQGSRMFLEQGSQVSVRDLLLGLVVQSGNDAAVALAEGIAGSEAGFADLMNQQARLLGMDDTNFVNSTGLNAKGQASTARDMALLGRALAQDYPELYRMHAEREYEFNGILQTNRNRLLEQYRGADGIKTGYTRAAGYCLAASAVRQGMRLVGVVLKSRSASSRAAEMTALFNYGFTHFRSVELFAPAQPLDDVKVWGGEELTVPVGYGGEDAYRILLTKADANNLKAVLRRGDQPLEAPVAAGAEVARIKLTAGDKEIADLPAVALADVGPGPWWHRLADYVRLHWLVPDVKEAL